MASEPVIVEVALNGMTTPERNPHVPRTPDEIATCALACIELGAAVVHTHVESIALPAAESVDLYTRSWKPILAERPDALVYPTQILGPTMADKISRSSSFPFCNCCNARMPSSSLPFSAMMSAWTIFN